MGSEIELYEKQLAQVQLEISNCSDFEKRATLIQLESDIKELIKLTLESHSKASEETLDAEYELFKAELAHDEEKNAGKQEEEHEEEQGINKALEDLQNDFDSIPGMKCQAPFKHSWCDEPVYHNALVFKVEKCDEVSTADDISVRVMFTNPTHIEMMPCPYFLEGECRFDRDKCRYSHGEVVPFVNLKEYREPNFSALLCGSRVLVKQIDGLWRRAIIQSVNDDKCVIKMESNSREEEADLQDIFPLEGPVSEETSGNDYTSDDDSLEQQPDVFEVLRQMPKSSALGDWEQYTTGFGSRIMAQMGYVHGAGLGARADGRVEPVPAVVYPSGKSLDHCMMLKEKAGGDQDLFKAERKMRRIQKKHEDALNRAYEKEKQRIDVFTFINDRLGHSEKPTPSNPGPSTQKQLQNTTQKGLNVSSLQIAEDVRKTEKEKKKLNESLSRHSSSSPAHAAIREKIRECDSRLSQLQESERKISRELQKRSDQRKLSVF